MWEKPRGILVPNEITKIEGENVVFSLNILSPINALEWFFEEERIAIFSENLILNDLSVNHTGLYSVRLTNEVGSLILFSRLNGKLNDQIFLSFFPQSCRKRISIL